VVIGSDDPFRWILNRTAPQRYGPPVPDPVPDGPARTALNRTGENRTAMHRCGTMGACLIPEEEEYCPMAEVRRAEATWFGDLVSGSGVVSAATSGKFRDLGVTWADRTQESSGKTSPEELLAASHAACFSMAFSARLAKNGTPPSRLDVTADVTFAQVDSGWKVASSALTVRGEVPGISQADFTRIAEDARDNCPISVALKGNLELSVDATLV
jgi:lipoyl-dependent peroxiredoxin